MVLPKTQQEIDNAIASPEVYSDPSQYHDLFAWLRANDPVRWTEPEGIRPFWAVTKHHDIAEVQRKPKLFLNAPRTQIYSIQAEEEMVAATGRRQAQRTLISTDAEEHEALRAIARDYFSPDSIRQLTPRVREISNELIDYMADLKSRECDFMADVAVWVPLRLILSVFGLGGDREAEKTLLRLAKEMNGANDDETRRGNTWGEHMLAVVGEMFQFFKPLLEERRKNPRDDLASVIATAKLNGELLDDLAVFSYYLTITVAGHDTTSAAIGGGLEALLQNPGELAKLRADPSLIPLAANEMVRWTHPVKHFFRTAAEDYELRGKTIRKGDFLLMCYPSACRDEDVFDDPGTFLVDRKPNPHLAFGLGPHVCLGQALAKIEIAAFFEEFLKRVSHVELAGAPVQSRTLFMGGLKRLPIRYRMAEELELADAG